MNSRAAQAFCESHCLPKTEKRGVTERTPIPCLCAQLYECFALKNLSSQVLRSSKCPEGFSCSQLPVSGHKEQEASYLFMYRWRIMELCRSPPPDSEGHSRSWESDIQQSRRCWKCAWLCHFLHFLFWNEQSIFSPFLSTGQPTVATLLSIT